MKPPASRSLEADLLIVGGGMVGLSLARACGLAGLRVVVVDRETPQAQAAPAADGRVSSLAWGACEMFRVLGLWDAMAPYAEPILDIRVADGDSPLFLHFDSRDVADHPFGYMVENRRIRAALHGAIPETPNIVWLAPCAVERLTRGPGRVEARLNDGRTAHAALAVAADGRNSALREAAGIRCLAWDYGQDAIVCTVAHTSPHAGVAKEHFLPSGPFAALPMRDDRSSIVWSLPRDEAAAIHALSDEALAAELQTVLQGQLGELRIVGPRWRYPLRLQNAERYVDRRLALAGDAAHAMHPIAGQGLNLGLRDVACLAEICVETARLGLDVGGDEPLRRYQQWRRGDALAMLAMTDGLNRLFSNDFAPLRIARRLGLGLVNAIGPAKRFFEARASAVAGDLPRLARGLPL